MTGTTMKQTLRLTTEAAAAIKVKTTYLRRSRVPTIVALLACNLGFSVSVVLAQGDPVVDAKGLQNNRDYFSQQPSEHIDTFTGSLVLTYTDLVLPGNAG